MRGLSSGARLEPGLPVDQIESRLCDAANRHHLAERDIAYWLHEIDQRRLYKERGFSSVGDYSMELIGIKPRKAQYLVFIASRLESLPKIREAFDSGELPWTKAREVVSVATPETEAEWLAKARALSNRELEKEVRRHDGRGSGEFATLTISVPVEILEMWNDAYELAERVSGTELEKWQVLEPALAEFLGTHLPDNGAGARPPDEEREIPDETRNAVLDRDRWQCRFPGCTMRKMLDVHHIEFRSHGGSDEMGNLISTCRIHHDLIHRGICEVTGTVGVDLRFERPRLVTEQERATEEAVVEDVPEEASHEAPATADVDPDDGDDASWRDEVVADIFDGPPTPKREKSIWAYADFICDWVDQKRARDLEARAHRRRAATAGPAGKTRRDAHVCVAAEGDETPDLGTNGGRPMG